jgi:serine/threonine protein kinase
VGKGMIAVKKLSKTSALPETKFHREIECLMKAKHKNIVRFLGYCSEVQGRIADHGGKFVMSDIRNWLLCFEYVPNGSLDKHITGMTVKFIPIFIFFIKYHNVVEDFHSIQLFKMRNCKIWSQTIFNHAFISIQQLVKDGDLLIHGNLLPLVAPAWRRGGKS